MGAFANRRKWLPVVPAGSDVPVCAADDGQLADASRGDYFRDLVVGVRTDGGWLCVHQTCLELCPVCTFRMDIRYRRIVGDVSVVSVPEDGQGVQQ